MSENNDDQQQHTIEFAKICERCHLTPKIGFIGGGNMAGALITGFLSSGIISAKSISVVDPNEKARQKLSEAMNVNAYSSIEKVLDDVRGGILILAVKPDCVSDFYKFFADRTDHQFSIGLFVSVCAGISLNSIEKNLFPYLKNLPVVRVMPNTPALVGCAASAFSAGQHVTDGHCKIVENLLETIGTCHQVKENLMDAVTGLSASGPAYIFTVIDALSDGGVKMGLPRDMAINLAAQTVLGSAQMVLKTGKHPGELKNMVCSPGGTTIAGVHVLEEAKTRSAFMSAVEAATNKAKELGNKS